MQAQLDTASPYVPRQDGSEGVGSYAQKLAEAGLDLAANPREVVYNHPMVGACFCHQCLAHKLAGPMPASLRAFPGLTSSQSGTGVPRAPAEHILLTRAFRALDVSESAKWVQAAMARLAAAIAAGYDPDAEFRSMLGRLMTDDELEDAAELDDDGSMPNVQEGQPDSMTPDLDAEFNEQLSEEERRDEQGMMNPVRLLHVHVRHLMCYQYLLIVQLAIFQRTNFHSKVSTSDSGMASPACREKPCHCLKSLRAGDSCAIIAAPKESFAVASGARATVCRAASRQSCSLISLAQTCCGLGNSSQLIAACTVTYASAKPTC